MRLLFCNLCKTLEEVPDYDGPMEKDAKGNDIDPLVEALVLKHNQRDPMGHGGERTGQAHDASPMRVAYVEPDPNRNLTSDEVWMIDRDAVLKQINESNQKVGFDAWVSEAVNTYQEDALRCYKEHHRPQEGCIDWWDDSKRIGRPTAIGRQEARDFYKLAKRDPHLCQFCPVASWVQTQKNWKAGLYKK